MGQLWTATQIVYNGTRLGFPYHDLTTPQQQGNPLATTWGRDRQLCRRTPVF